MCENARSPVDIEVFWPDQHHSPDPPNCWQSWLEGFKIALLAKTSIAYDALLDDPTEHVAPPHFTNAPAGESDEAREARLEANRTAQQDYKTRCEQAWAVDHNGTPRRLADQKARAMLFMSLGTEAKKRLTQRANELRLNDYTLATFHAELTDMFTQATGVTFERIALFRRRQRPTESLRDFHAALSKMVVKCDFGNRADSVVRDLFLTYMRDTELQKRLCMEQMDPGETLRLTVAYEMGLLRQRTIQEVQRAGGSQGTQPSQPHEVDMNATLDKPLVKEEPLDINVVTNRRTQRPNGPSRGRSGGPHRTSTPLKNGRSPTNAVNNIIAEWRKAGKCKFCGGKWDPDHASKCPAKGTTCRFCNKKNHFEKVCLIKLQNASHSERGIRVVDEAMTSRGSTHTDAMFQDLQEISDDEFDHGVLAIATTDKSNRTRIVLKFADTQEASFLLDTGAVASLMNLNTLKRLAPLAYETMTTTSAMPQRSPLTDFNGNEVQVLGTHSAFIQYGDWHTTASFHVVAKGINVLGVDVLPKLGFSLQQAPKPSTGKPQSDMRTPLTIKHWSDSQAKATFNARYPELFKRIGRVKHHMVRSRFVAHYKPIQQKGRRIPITIQPKVEAEIKRLIAEGHIEKLQTCTDDCFISPIVVTVKKDGTCKLAMDSKAINKTIFKNKYQMTNIDELLDNISQIITSRPNRTTKVWFSMLDLRYAYGQVPLSPETSRQCNFSIVGGQATGTYRFKTGFYGLADMPAEFQQTLDLILQDMPQVHAFIDDILIVTVGTADEHMSVVDQALHRLDNANMSLKLSKCSFLQPEVNWLGYTINAEGTSPMPNKTITIQHLAPPTIA